MEPLFKEVFKLAIEQTMKNSLSSDLVVRPEWLGIQTLLSPFPQHSSTQRQTMYASEVSQALVVQKSEFPRIATGYEQMIGKYELTTCRLDQDIMIRKIIPKFNPMNLHSVAEEIPSWVVIYMGMEDRQIHCMEISKYTLLYDGCGYFNKMLGFDEDMLFEGNVIPKDTKLITSPSHNGNFYNMGVNANVCFLSMWGVTEDAFIVSRSLADKCRNTSICQVKLNIGLDVVPLDLYGEDGNYKCFPDIGDTVRQDGVLIALRKINKNTFVADMTPEALRNIEQLHDECYRAPVGSKVIDVDVYINQQALKKMKDRDISIYQQFIDFMESHRYQQNTILKAYRDLCEKENLPCAPEFNTAVFNAAMLSGNKEFVNGTVKLTDGREPIEFITVVITYSYERSVTVGSKLAGRDGKQFATSAREGRKTRPRIAENSSYQSSTFPFPAGHRSTLGG